MGNILGKRIRRSLSNDERKAREGEKKVPFVSHHIQCEASWRPIRGVCENSRVFPYLIS